MMDAKRQPIPTLYQYGSTKGQRSSGQVARSLPLAQPKGAPLSGRQVARSLPWRSRRAPRF